MKKGPADRRAGPAEGLQPSRAARAVRRAPGPARHARADACRYHSCGALESGRQADIEDVFVDAGKLASGAISFEDLCAASEAGSRVPASCSEADCRAVER
ncbi:hypothetical protein [Amycolatopsis sp. FDAARGOS 1241]|uniref:hypothetical protein n=1 Tax=Amycolatopsis sp. FDAARGOS 1241 TaxID=2778070 RepID=UPI0019515FE6|nr:hypothetical protein [Amycolatopsis sp. FDAARGOS 1241]QRP47642.1 hypothetical protein I6J71_06805 [Amycolatopsis sp. FDAARGOS 1241]